MAFRVLGELPARIYQRQPQLWERLALAAGWSLLYLLVSDVGRLAAAGTASTDPGTTPANVVMAFPTEWRLVLAVLVFVMGAWKPIAGYAAFVVAVAYPLYLVSIYVMALALAVLILLLPVMAVYSEQGVLFLALLVFLTPLLARVHLAPLVPLLVGLWWVGAGSWIGGGPRRPGPGGAPSGWYWGGWGRVVASAAGWPPCGSRWRRACPGTRSTCGRSTAGR